MVLGASLAVGLSLAGCASSPSVVGDLVPTQAAVAPTPSGATRPVATLGSLVVRRPEQTPRDALEEVDAAAGRRVDLVRVDMDWTSDFPTRDIAEMIDDGRSVYLTITPRRIDGSAVAWADIANRRAPVLEDLDRWAEMIASTPEISMVTFHPSADLETDPGFGSAEDFRSAWSAFFDAVNAADRDDDSVAIPDGELPSRRRLWVASDVLLRTGDPNLWYPGDTLVEAIGTENYNNYDCGAEPVAWQTPRQMLSPLVAFGSQHEQKSLVAAALATVEDDANETRKAQWYASIAEMLAAPELAKLDTVVVKHGADPLVPRCAWWVDSSPVSASGFGALASDPIVDGNHAAPADVRCAKIASYQALRSDGAATDVDRDGHADLYFGSESRVVGVGEEGADGRDQRVLLPFGPLDADPSGDERVILRVQLSGAGQRSAPPVKLSVLDRQTPVSEAGFDAASRPIDLAFMNSESLPGYYLIDVTDYVSAEHGVTFRLELEEPPALDGGGDPYPITMSEAELPADRPTLVVRAC